MNLLKIEEIQIFNNKETAENLHIKIIKLRNSAAAHSDWNFYNTSFHEGEGGHLPHRTFKRIQCRDEIGSIEFQELISHTLFFLKNLSLQLDSRK